MGFSLNGQSVSLLYMMMAMTLILALFFNYVYGLRLAESSVAQLEDVGVNIDLLSDSSVRFFKCGTTPANGTSIERTKIDEIDESAQNVLTDRDLDTILMGDARFVVSSSQNSSIVNNPGPDLMVVEMAGTEPINASVVVPDTGETRSVMLSPVSTSNDNSCDYAMNQALLDLSSLGIPEATGVPLIRLENLGYRNTAAGSDIAEVFILEGNVKQLPPPFSGGQ